MLSWCWLAYDYFLGKEYLPNGYALSPAHFDRSKIQLTDNGEQVASSVGAVMWCNDTVYGTRYDIINDGIEVDGKKQDVNIGYLFAYNRSTKSFWQYKTSISYSLGLGSNHSEFFPENEREFNEKVTELGIPSFDLKKSVGFRDLDERLIKVSSDEVCRKSGDRYIKG